MRLLSEERVKTFSTPRAETDRPDAVLGIQVRMGTAGFWLGGSTDPKDPFRLAGRNPRTLFHPGAGGAVAWGDPDARLAVAICHNGMSNNLSKTFQPIRAAVEQVFGALWAVGLNGLSSKRAPRPLERRGPYPHRCARAHGFD